MSIGNYQQALQSFNSQPTPNGNSPSLSAFAQSLAKSQPQQSQPQQPQQPMSFQQQQGQWAQQYMNAARQGNANPNELNRYLDYQYMLPTAKNTNMINGQGANLQAAQRDFMNRYGQAIQNGTNNLSQLGQYQGYLKAFGGTAAAPSQQTLQQLSIGALNGDIGAQNYLNAMHVKPVSGMDLWKGYDPSQLKANTGAWSQYIQDNPYSQTAKNDDEFKYQQYGNILKNGGQLDGRELQQYQNIAQKWNMADLSDPQQMELNNLQADKEQALNAQDVATNQALSTADANNFQTMQKAQQEMSNRGMADSGLAQDAYARATMAANQQYQKAYADAAMNKADIGNKYDQQVDTLNKNIADTNLNKAKFQYQQQKDALDNQTKQDQFLTTQTGTVYLNGSQLTGKNGQPITTLDWAKMSETQRHDLATENTANDKNKIDAQKVSNDYNLGLQSNQINATKVANDYNLGLQKNNNDYSLGMTNANNNATKIANDYAIAKGNLQVAINKENLASQQAQASIQDARDKLAVAQQNASTDQQKALAATLGKRLDNVTSQMNAWIKAHPNAQDVPQSYKDEYNSIASQMDGINFPTNGGGSGATQKITANNVAGGTWNQLLAAGFTPNAAAAVMGNIQQESSFNPNVNADGLAQWSDPSRKAALKQYAAQNGYSNYLDPNAQIGFLIQEIKSGNQGANLAQLNKLSAQDGAVYLSNNYERPRADVANNAGRASYANQFLAQYGGGR